MLSSTARIVIDIQGLYVGMVPGILPSVETWEKQGSRWVCNESDLGPACDPEGNWQYTLQDTDKNRGIAAMFWLRRGCRVRIEKGKEVDPFPAKEQTAWENEDSSDALKQKKELAELEKRLIPLQEKLAQVSDKHLAESEGWRKSLFLAERENEVLKEDVKEEKEALIAKLASKKEKIFAEFTDISSKIRDLKIKVG